MLNPGPRSCPAVAPGDVPGCHRRRRAENLGGYTLIIAGSLDDATKIVQDHPFVSRRAHRRSARLMHT
jgi:hypothetical protein